MKDNAVKIPFGAPSKYEKRIRSHITSGKMPIIARTLTEYRGIRQWLYHHGYKVRGYKKKNEVGKVWFEKKVV